jgi:hypothetical protein
MLDVINDVFHKHEKSQLEIPCILGDEGMTTRPSTFAYLVFGPEETTIEGIARPIRAAAGRGSGAILGVQARIRGVQIRLVFG